MNNTGKILIAIAVIGLIPAMFFIQRSMSGQTSEEKAIEVAEEFVMNSPTFSFDGMEETLQVLGSSELRTENTWEVEIQFTSRNGGYGDRTGQMVITVLTEHIMVLIIHEGEVTSAITDWAYDEINDISLSQGDAELVEARELALEYMSTAPTYIYDGVEGSMRIVDVAIAESYPVQYFVSIEFQCAHAGYGDRTGQVLAQVVTPHEARVVVVSGVIRRATIDGAWNELTQEEL